MTQERFNGSIMLYIEIELVGNRSNKGKNRLFATKNARIVIFKWLLENFGNDA